MQVDNPKIQAQKEAEPNLNEEDSVMEDKEEQEKENDVENAKESVENEEKETDKAEEEDEKEEEEDKVIKKGSQVKTPVSKNPKAEMREATIERPSTERKTVERYTEVSVGRGSGTKPFSIQKYFCNHILIRHQVAHNSMSPKEEHKLKWMNLWYKHRNASPVADLLAFRKVRAGLGGWLRLIVTGSSPLSNEIEEFMRVTSCAFVMQGYDQIPIGLCRQFASK